MAVANVPAFAPKTAASTVSSSVPRKKSVKLTMWPLVAMMVLIGVYPPLIINTINIATTALLGIL